MTDNYKLNLIKDISDESLLCVPDLVDRLERGKLLFIPEEGMGEIFDGNHTFNELYHHRAVLFSVICKDHKDIAWKSKNHEFGGFPMFAGMFIVGIDTPDGQATYHYYTDKYWDMFDVKELEYAPKWDGHTSEQAIERISKL